jgi:hypothetical protein
MWEQRHEFVLVVIDCRCQQHVLDVAFDVYDRTRGSSG